MGRPSEFTTEEIENWHTWCCGCKSGAHGAYFDIVYCKRDCVIYQDLIEGREVEHIDGV